MGRKAHANYAEIARTILQELGGGHISTKTLVDAARERGLIPDGKWTYHNFARAVRVSEEFDTSVRGQVSLIEGAEAVAEAIEEPEEVVEEVQEEYPGPTFRTSLVQEG